MWLAILRLTNFRYQCIFVFGLVITLMACKKEEDSDTDLECYVCTHENMKPAECSELYSFEACIIGYRDGSTLPILEITQKCNEDLTVTERTSFIEDFINEQTSAGATCEKK